MAEEQKIQQRGVTVLVVEDEFLVRMMLADFLRQKGLTVVEARHGEEALSIFKSITQVDLIITDVRMPGAVDGLALAHHVKQTRRVPVIIVSGHFDAPLPVESADAFFRKPYDPEVILASVHELLSAA